MKSPLEIVDALRGWTGNMLSDDQPKAFRYPDLATGTEKHLTFTQVLLRSSAIEELMAFIVSTPHMRTSISDSWPSVRQYVGLDMEDLSHAQLVSAHLYQFLSRALSTIDDKMWFELVKMLLAPHGEDMFPKSDEVSEEEGVSDLTRGWLEHCEKTGFRWLEISALSKLKRDWYDDWLEKERRDLATLVDTKRTRLIQTDVQESTWSKILLSGELVDLYESVKDNLDDCAAHRTSVRKSISGELSATISGAKKQVSLAETNKSKYHARQEELAASTQQLESQYKPKLDAILEERSTIDFKIASLEEEKQRLKRELERVSQELVDAQTAQRDAMDYESQVRAELGANRSKLAQQLTKEKQAEQACIRDTEMNMQFAELIANMQAALDTNFEAQTTQLGEVYTQFDSAFIEAVQDHMSILCDCVQDLYRRIKRLSDETESVKRTRNAQSVTQMLHLNGSEKEEFSATEERLDVKLNELSDRLSVEAANLEKFDRLFSEFYKRFETKLASNRLIRGEVDKIRIVYGEADKVVQKYIAKPAVVKGPELLVDESPPESPRPINATN